jgi:hypothetical protein
MLVAEADRATANDESTNLVLSSGYKLYLEAMKGGR